MKVIALRIKAPQVSFRRPLDLNYQRTLPLPPPTTLIGLAGAALGISDFQLWNDSTWKPLRELKVAAFMNKPVAKAKDMMKVLKVKSGKISERSPYFRELLFNVEYTIFYGGDDAVIKKLAHAFLDPVFPLSLGREDELIDIISLNEVEPGKGEPYFYGTALPFDIREIDFKIPGLYGEKAPLKLEPAIIENVPLAFKVEKGYRVPVKKKVITFVPYALKIKFYALDKEIFSFDNRNFTWMNY